MATNQFTELNLGSGGSKMDESGLTSPEVGVGEVRRSRILISGDSAYGEISRVLNSSIAGNEYGLVVRNINDAPSGSVITADSASVDGDGIEDTVVTYTVPGSKVFMLTGFTATGDLPGKYTIYQGATAIMSLRTTSSFPNLTHSFNIPPLKATAAQTITIKVQNFVTGVTGNYDATILGYEVNV